MISPAVGSLFCELCRHQGKVFLHLNPEIGLGDAAVMRMNGVNASHFSGNQSVGRHAHANINISVDIKCAVVLLSLVYFGLRRPL